MLDENGAWKTTVAPDGRELVTIGTPEFPAEMWGPWNFEGGTGKVPWHWHEELELNMTIWGTEQVTADGKSFLLEPGQGVFVNSGVLHGSEPGPGHDTLYHDSLVFHPSLVGGASGSVFWQKYLTPVLMAPECRCVPLRGETEWERKALEQLRFVARVWPEKEPGYEVEVRAALSRVICLLAENCVHHAQAPSGRELRDAERIKQMVDFIRSHRCRAHHHRADRGQRSHQRKRVPAVLPTDDGSDPEGISPPAPHPARGVSAGADRAEHHRHRRRMRL